MRVLVTTDTVGGVWSFTCELAGGMLELGVEVVLVSVGPAPNVDQQHWTERMVDEWGRRFQFESLDAPLEWMPNNEFALSGASDALVCISKELGVDLLHSNQFCFAALNLDMPKVVTAHSDVLSWGKACRPDGLEDSEWLRRYRGLVQCGLLATDVLVAPTQWMLDALKEKFRLRGDARIIPNGRQVTTLPEGPRQMQAVTAGRLWDEAKNIDLLYEVNSPLPLIVAGDSFSVGVPDGASHVKMLGRLSETDLLGVFQRSEMYVCSSRYEPFGLAPLEAALCGCAVLANCIPSLHEVWEDGALYFDNASSLSKLLVRLHSDSELLSGAKRRSFERAQKYSRERMTASYVSVYKTVLARYHETAHVA